MEPAPRPTSRPISSPSPRGATRLLLLLVRHLSRIVPSAASVGGSGRRQRRSSASATTRSRILHASDVTKLRVVRRGDRLVAEITTGFLGVVGSVSPLANYFTEDVLRADSLDESALRAFYDLFHHRLIAFVYGAHLRAAPSWEVRADGSDRVTRRSIALTASPRPGPEGAGSARWSGRARADRRRRPRSRSALEAALLLAFPNMPIRVLDFLSLTSALPSRAGPARPLQRDPWPWRASRLAPSPPDGLVRLAAGPLGRAAFDALLPGAPLTTPACGRSSIRSPAGCSTPTPTSKSPSAKSRARGSGAATALASAARRSSRARARRVRCA